MTKINCSIEATLALIGETWSLLILREIFWGHHRFSDFHTNLGIAKNLLSERLKKLCDNDILTRVPCRPGSSRLEYHLTPRGYDLYPVLLSLMQWGDQWLCSENQVPVIISDPDGNTVAPLTPSSSTGTPLTFHSLRVTQGPGANEQTRKRIIQVNSKKTTR